MVGLCSLFSGVSIGTNGERLVNWYEEYGTKTEGTTVAGVTQATGTSLNQDFFVHAILLVFTVLTDVLPVVGGDYLAWTYVSA